MQNIAAQVEITLIDEGIKKIDNEILKVNKAKSADRTGIRLYEREVERLNSLKRDPYKRKQKILTY